MRRLSLLLPAVVVLLFCARSHAACTGVTSGMPEAGVVSAINACSSAGGGTVNFGAGTYGPFTSNFTLPCNVSLSGPVVPYSQTHNQTAILNGSVSFIGQPLHITSGCSSSQTISYLEWNGKQPTTGGGGGGFIYVPAGANHLIVSQNYVHGMNAPSSDTSGDQNTQANGIYMDGSGTSTMTQNIQITLNEFGTESYQGDCAGAMTERNTENGGGFCNGVGIHNQTNNISIDHNIFHYLEQGVKSYEGNNGNPGSGGGNDNNFTLSYNSFSYIQRIPFETQANLTVANSRNPTLQFIQYNYFGNRYNGNGGQQNFEVSMANGCGNGSSPLIQCTGHLDYNVFVENVNNPARSAGNEIWGDDNTTANYNLFQGYVAGAGGAIDWSQNGNFTFNNNTFNIVSGSGTNCVTQGGGYWNNEGSNHPAHTQKACTGNTYSNAGTGTTTSAAPAISPASGAFSGTQTITLTNTGTNRDTNTSIWYTTNGSTPVPGTSGTILYTGPFSITSTTAINAVGMWGAENQPTSYPKGFGYAPSGTVSAIYTASGVAPVTPVRPTTPVPPVTPTAPVPPVTPTAPVPPVTPTVPVAPVSPTLTSAYLGTSNNVNTMVVGDTLQFGAMGIYGTSPTAVPIPSSQVVWSSSNPAVITVDATGKVTAVGAGKANVQDQIGTVTGGAWTITVTGKVLTSAYLATANNANTMVVGGTLQFGAMGIYGTSSTPVPIPASQVAWSSSNPAVFTVDATGKVTAVGAGKANVQDQIGAVTGGAWTITVTGKVLTSAYLATANNANTMVVGDTLQFGAMGIYATSPTPVPIPASQVVWSSSNPAVLTVDATGKVTAAGAGKANVQDQIGTVTGGAWTITVKGKVLTSAYLATANNVSTMVVGDTLQFGAMGIYGTGSTPVPIPASQVVWSSSNPAVLTVDATGKVTAVGAGKANVQDQIGTVTGSAWAITATGKVLKSAYLATPNNVNTMTVGGTLKFGAMGIYGTSSTPVPIPASQVVWSSSNPAVLTVDATGKVTAVGAGKANVQDQIGTVTGSAWTITAKGKVIKSAYLGTSSGAKSMTVGSTMQLTAYVTYSDGTTGTLPDASGNVVTSWNTTNHKVAVVSSQGQATALSKGSINMEATVGTLRLSPLPVTVGASATPAARAAAVPTTPAAGPVAVPSAPGAAIADTFRGPFWRLATPAGGSASISNSHLFLGVPGGANHDPLLPSNQAVRVVQTIGRENFDVAIKIDSQLFAADGNTSQGLMILSESGNFITFALTTDGTKIGLNARKVTGGAATTVLNDTDFSQYQNPMYLRVKKAGSAFVGFYSADGSNWSQAVSFTDTTIFSSIGPFASNYSSTPGNAAPVVMSVNSFDVQQ